MRITKEQLKKIIREQMFARQGPAPASKSNISHKELQEEAFAIADGIKDGALVFYSELMVSQAQEHGVHKRDIQGWLEDIKDVLMVIHYLEYGEFKKAYNLAGSLDTAVRDDLPMEDMRRLVLIQTGKYNDDENY